MAQPSDPNVLLRRAQSFHQSGKMDKAIAIYRQLAPRFPGNARLLFLFGSAESQNANGGEAVRLLEQCLRIDPLDADAYNNLGLALETQERCDEALQSYDRAIALQAGRPEAYINKGLALQKRGHPHAALWAGLPVLTCAGEPFASRVAASLVPAVGLPELITTTPAAFEALAIALASDRARLEQVRAKLLANRPTAPLFDTPRFARHIEAAYA